MIEEPDPTPTPIRNEELPTHISEDDREMLTQVLIETAPAIATREFVFKQVFTKPKYKINPATDTIDDVTGEIKRGVSE
jgi:hypothetical protein